MNIFTCMFVLFLSVYICLSVCLSVCWLSMLGRINVFIILALMLECMEIGLKATVGRLQTDEKPASHGIGWDSSSTPDRDYLYTQIRCALIPSSGLDHSHTLIFNDC